MTTHLHDNRRKSDDHLAPGDGGIDWPAALVSLQKIGYDGTWLFEVANVSTPKAVLEKTAGARSSSKSCWISISKNRHALRTVTHCTRARIARSHRATAALAPRRTHGTCPMNHVYIDKIGEHVGETVTIKGWLHNRRSSGKIHFLVVRDGTGFLQVVMGKNDVPEETSRLPITCHRKRRSS